MPDNTYPVFESGQTLTATDLNLLRAFLHERDRLVGRMIGFGINAGLGGSCAGATLTIQAGLAIDQVGEPLVLTAPQTIPLPPTAMTPSYDFISGTTGFSVVLEASETVDPAPDCGEADCAGHAEHHTKGVELRTVTGRLSGAHFDFSSEPLLLVEPIRLGLDSAPTTSFADLRNAIADRLTNGTSPLISAALITELRSRTVLVGDSPAVKGYKCGWLNMVLFATLDLLRLEALLAVSADRTTARPGVCLGWVHQVAGTWVFECGYRHAWEPPRGFTEAFLGGTCTDPAGHYRDLVEEIISGYAPPDPPPPGGGGVTPPVQCPKGTIRVGNECRHVYYPPIEIPDKWADPWLVPFNPLDPIWDPPFEDPGWLVDPWEVYGSDPIDFFGDGQIGGLQYVGQPGDDVEGVLTTYINGKGGVADVRVVSHTEAQGLPGYHPSSSFAPSDTIVLSVNQAGNVIATGRVSAARNTRNVSSALPAAQAALEGAQQVADGLNTLASGLRSDFATLDQGVADLGREFQTLQGQFADYRGGAFDTSGYGVRIDHLEHEVVDLGGFGQRLSTLEGQIRNLARLDEQVSEVRKYGDRIGTLEGQFAQLGKFDEQIAEFGEWGQRVAKLEGQVGYLGKTGFAGPVKGMSPAVGRSFGEFAETTVAAVRAMEKSGTLTQRYATDVERAHAQLEVDVAAGDPEVIAGSAMRVMKSMRTMVKAAAKGTPEAATLGSQLDAQIRDIESKFG